MLKIKSFTNLKQSKQLEKMLPIESADMRYHNYLAHNPSTNPQRFPNNFPYLEPDSDVPCWSLAALFNALPLGITHDGDRCYFSIMQGNVTKWHVKYLDYKGNPHITSSDNSIVDACYNMILKLYENNMLGLENEKSTK